eukprot:scaffold79_cov259-Pinguiococcus_pyrenoidosus.AAC.29
MQFRTEGNQPLLQTLDLARGHEVVHEVVDLVPHPDWALVRRVDLGEMLQRAVQKLVEGTFGRGRVTRKCSTASVGTRRVHDAPAVCKRRGRLGHHDVNRTGFQILDRHSQHGDPVTGIRLEGGDKHVLDEQIDQRDVANIEDSAGGDVVLAPQQKLVRRRQGDVSQRMLGKSHGEVDAGSDRLVRVLQLLLGHGRDEGRLQAPYIVL